MSSSISATAGLPGENPSQALAVSAVAALRADDRTAAALAIELVQVAPGQVTVSMVVTEAMINGHGVVHGGYLFLLADTAFAYASSTHGGTVVSRHGEITFVAPGQLGDRLLATAEERARYGNSGIYDVTVCLAEGTRLAEFRGQSHGLRGPLVIKR
jgi:acyl-CoA thioesterase